MVHVDEVEELLEVPVDGQQWQQEPRVDRLENLWLCESVRVCVCVRTRKRERKSERVCVIEYINI